jgi:hypothetical protein
MIALAAVAVGSAREEARADHMACSRPALPMPRTVSIHPDTPGIESWREGMATIERASDGRVDFLEQPYGSETHVYILPSATYSDGATWVQMPCGRIESEVYAGTEPGVERFATHEMMHTLGFADHVYSWTALTQYVNAVKCAASPYRGVMSYCSMFTDAWGGDDLRLFWWWF